MRAIDGTEAHASGLIEGKGTTDVAGPNSGRREIPADSPYIAEGTLVAGKYLVERVLGVGGMAFVVSARHVELGEHFALKFLGAQFLGNAALIERFTREARAACKIRSEHVARVFDVGTHEGAPYLVMEQLEGRDLGTVLAESGALAIDDAVEIVMQVCEALSAAHAHGIVHRDIKPENLFLVEQSGLPMIKLLDFGISKVALTTADAPSRLTGKLTLGTPCFMAPEQIRSTASADARSDLWSLGVVLYELLTGAEAFRGETITELCAAVLESEPRPIRGLRPDVPDALAHVVGRCMRKDPHERFGNVAELAVALLPFAPTRALVSAERSSSRLKVASPDCMAPVFALAVPRSPTAASLLGSIAPVIRPADACAARATDLSAAPAADEELEDAREGGETFHRARSRRPPTIAVVATVLSLVTIGLLVVVARPQIASFAATARSSALGPAPEVVVAATAAKPAQTTTAPEDDAITLAAIPKRPPPATAAPPPPPRAPPTAARALPAPPSPAPLPSAMAIRGVPSASTTASPTARPVASPTPTVELGY